jgi:hypothetical protein
MLADRWVPQVINATDYYLPLYFQTAKGASPTKSGVMLLPLIITEALVAAASGVIIHRSGRYVEMIWVGVVLLTLGNGLYLNLDASSSVGKIIGFEIVAGLGAGLLFDPPVIALQALVSQENTATATATIGLVRNVGVALAIVISGVVFQNGMQLQASNLREDGLALDLAEKLSGPNAATNINLIATISDEGQELAVRNAFAWSLRNVWIMATAMAAMTILVGGLVSKKELSEEHTETKTGLEERKEPTTNTS